MAALSAQGSEIAKLAGGQLGWDVLDREIIDALVEKYGTPRDLLEFVDEKHVRLIEEVFDGWLVVQHLMQLFMTAAGHGNVVIVGRGAQFVLPHERGISVRVVAPLEHRITRVAENRSCTREDARQFVLKRDREREEFVRRYFDHQATDAHQYDLVINVEKLDSQDAADLIVMAVKSWMQHQAG